jgi:hypothetical protein
LPGQRLEVISFVRITKSEFIKHQLPDKTLLKSSAILKVNGVINFKTDKKTITLKDDSENVEYNIIGDIKNSSLTLIHELGPNTEEYYFIDRQTAKIDTLAGYPVFATNKKDIVCLQGAGTDINQKIQIGQFINEQYLKRGMLQLKDEIYPEYIFWFDSNTLYIEDSREHYWKLRFNMNVSF